MIIITNHLLYIIFNNYIIHSLVSPDWNIRGMVKVRERLVMANKYDRLALALFVFSWILGCLFHTFSHSICRKVMSLTPALQYQSPLCAPEPTLTSFPSLLLDAHSPLSTYWIFVHICGKTQPGHHHSWWGNFVDKHRAWWSSFLPPAPLPWIFSLSAPVSVGPEDPTQIKPEQTINSLCWQSPNWVIASFLFSFYFWCHPGRTCAWARENLCIQNVAPKALYS